MKRRVIVAIVVTLAPNLPAQRVFETGDRVVYQDNQGRRVDLGAGFGPLLTAEGKIGFIRGRRFAYGETFDCRDAKKKNWIALYDPATKVEKTLFDGALDFDGRGIPFCVFEQMGLSHDVSMLYLVRSPDAGSGSLAIVNLARGSAAYVPDVESVYVIETGPHRDELIYVQRIMHKSAKRRLPFPAYPIIHARANGEQIAEISNESLTAGGDGGAPMLKAYLSKIGGTITVNGRKLP
jgi:hypothetical protein